MQLFVNDKGQLVYMIDGKECMNHKHALWLNSVLR